VKIVADIFFLRGRIISDKFARHDHRSKSRSFVKGFKVTWYGYELFCCRKWDSISDDFIFLGEHHYVTFNLQYGSHPPSWIFEI